MKNWNAFTLTPALWILGIFVLGDAIVIGPFWLITLLIYLITKNINILLILISLFWCVRSAGEIIYWLNQQFSPINRNPNHARWFIYQTFWQMILVFSLLFTIILAKKL